MIHTTSESDVTSLGGSTSSSSASPKQHPATTSYYYVQSPSRDSHDDVDNKSSINSQTTPTYTSPMESPSHPSQSRPSSAASRISGPYRAISLGGKHHNHHIFRKKHHHHHKGWPPLFSVIDEEDGGYSDEDFHGDELFMRRCRITLSWRVNNFYYGEGLDVTGVPTKLLTVNCTVKMNIQNPATFFGIHVSSTSLNLFYSQVMVGTGQFMKYYQPKKSQRTVWVNLEGRRVPLYGAGAALVMSDSNGNVPLKLEFEIHSHANLVGKLVKTKHRRKVLCVMEVDPQKNDVIDFTSSSCSYN
ncbi:Late embryogenesis abundant protein, LEA-14 [Cynara cardunculus var. scolymus]|uniref:Late embryogenesis abundant protein, LEA-14 n=1 Tax=Cynara cardunculus var. scolymus TaxID=59895 RepID=A0A103Y2D9_CYNCS|nr:Late embryogenesis abundant protein, LEA-14 [Cynara cardunculus var. scolymus]